MVTYQPSLASVIYREYNTQRTYSLNTYNNLKMKYVNKAERPYRRRNMVSNLEIGESNRLDIEKELAGYMKLQGKK